MKKLNLLKFLIIMMTVLLSMGKAFCEATAVQVGYTLVQSTVAVEKKSENVGGSIEPSNGNASTLSSTFNLKSNDGETFFVVYSTLITDSGNAMSAFDDDENLLFANSNYPPTEQAVLNAKNKSGSSPNVIAYKMSMEGENLTITYTDSETYKECYKVELANSATSAELIHNVGGLPENNSYSTAEDIAGIYTVTMYVTATKKI